MKLTHYISLRYIGVTVLVMVISIPLFYFVVQNVLTRNIDENLSAQKKIIVGKLQHFQKENVVNFDDRIRIVKNPQQLLKERIYTKEVYNQVDNETESYRILAFPVQTPYAVFDVTVSESLVESEDLMKSILFLLISILAVLTGTLLLINIQVRNKVWKPFYGTLQQLKNFRVDYSDGLHLTPAKIDEFNDLNDSLNELAATNKKEFQSQKEFTENASHELQTPLAIIQNNVELFWQTGSISEQQAEIVSDISNAASRMAKLNQALLLLAKIENRQFTGIEPINFNNIVESFAKNYQEEISFKKLTLYTNFAAEFIAEADRNLAEILVGNLFFNALKFAPANTSVDICINKNQLIISNKATGSALNQENLFKRFQRQTTAEKGTGLGLEIAGKIAAAFHLNVTYRFEDHRHQFILNRN